MSEQAPEKILSGISIPKILAGALAAVSVAVVGSFLGVAGTLIGAAVASVVGTLGTEIYERSLKRGAAKLQTLAPTFIKAPAAVGTPDVAAAATPDDSPSHTVPEAARPKQIRWGRVGAAAGTIFVVAMGGIWVAEKALGEPLSTAVGATTSTGTTLGGTSPKSTPTPAPSATTSTAPSSSTTGTTAPSVNATTTAPAGTSASDPSAITPTTGAPAASAGSGGGGLAPTTGATGAGTTSQGS